MATPLNAREMKARQLVLAKGTLDAFAAKWKKYGTTTSSCNCMDWQVRGRRGEISACYHMIAKRLLRERDAAQRNEA